MKKVLFILFLLFCFISTAQNFDAYKYIVVPKTFSIFKSPDKYRTSALTKFLFNKKGYTVIYDDALPEDIGTNGCMGLKASLRNESNMFTTKVRLVLLDCNNKEIFVTDQGKSKEKEYAKSYSEAIRNAFKSFNEISYTYKPKKSEEDNKPIVLNFKNDVKNVESNPNIGSLKDDAKAVRKKEKLKKKKEKVESSELKKTAAADISTTQKMDALTLYAQEITNGFQLVDSAPKIRYKLYKTSTQGYFIAEKGSVNGIVINKNGNWFFEYYENNQLKSEELKIKF